MLHDIKGLFSLCADLSKYCIDLPNEPLIGPPSGILEILKWEPGLSLKCLCKSYSEGVVDHEVFNLDSFFGTVDEISEKLPGELRDQLPGIYHTNTQTDVQKGALALIETIEP